MLISYNWLKQYIILPDSITPQEVADRLKLSTVEVEKVEYQGKQLDNVVLGKVVLAEKHPNADRLKVCKVDVGNEQVQIVCGGSNVREGMLVALAKIGAKVKWHGEGELIELKPTKIRDVESSGMICASTEIGLGEMYPPKDEKEILDLSSQSEKKIGQSLSKVLSLDDVILEIDNKSLSHRPDLWGHYGIAREVGVLFKKDLKEYKTKEQGAKSKEQVKLKVTVEDEKLCPRYMAVAVDGVTVGPSPDWLQKSLMSVGMRSINNIVDITNYVMYDLGQPMHSFDAKRLKGTGDREQGTIKIIVRKSEDGEKFKTLDGQERELTSENVMIADEGKALALAGVMGGENSEISDNTTTIIFESANFEPTHVRRTALKLGLRTDSSARFEKSLDPYNAEIALRRAVELTLEICPNAKVASNVVDEKHFHLYQGPIELHFDFLTRKIGKEIDRKEVIGILQRLGFTVEEKKTYLKIKIPTWRATKDISIAEDIVEEVARIYGFGNIESQLPTFSITPPEKNQLRALERKIKELACFEHRFTESYNYSFVSPHLVEQLDLNIEDHVELDNPIAKDRPYLRRSLVPNLLENIEKNLHSFDEVRLFEIGKVFWKEEAGEREKKGSDHLLPKQDTMWGLAYAGKGDEKPFFVLSHVVVNTLHRLGIECTLQSAREHTASWFHGSRSAHIQVGDVRIGYIAELHPEKQERFGILSRVALAEIDLNTLVSLLLFKSNYHRLSEYPSVTRDIAFVVDHNVQHRDVVKEIKNVDTLINEIELFDIFEGESLGESKKSMAYHITYVSSEKTLETAEVDKVHGKVVKMLGDKFGAEMRK
ncbi:MAG: phenylalanine--tRNA ligase subunit beta [Candidatus Magasanikbacteria bacterium]